MKLHRQPLPFAFRESADSVRAARKFSVSGYTPGFSPGVFAAGKANPDGPYRASGLAARTAPRRSRLGIAELGQRLPAYERIQAVEALATAYRFNIFRRSGPNSRKKLPRKRPA